MSEYIFDQAWGANEIVLAGGRRDGSGDHRHRSGHTLHRDGALLDTQFSISRTRATRCRPIALRTEQIVPPLVSWTEPA